MCISRSFQENLAPSDSTCHGSSPFLSWVWPGSEQAPSEGLRLQALALLATVCPQGWQPSLRQFAKLLTFLTIISREVLSGLGGFVFEQSRESRNKIQS